MKYAAVLLLATCALAQDQPLGKADKGADKKMETLVPNYCIVSLAKGPRDRMQRGR